MAWTKTCNTQIQSIKQNANQLKLSMNMAMDTKCKTMSPTQKCLNENQVDLARCCQSQNNHSYHR